MERLDFKNDGARLHEGGSNGSSVRHVKQVIREVSVYIQRDKELQQASDAQFLVQCKPGSQRGRVSQADPNQDPESKEFLVTSMFGSSEENKNEDAKFESPTSEVVRKKQEVSVNPPAPQPEKTSRKTAAIFEESKRRRKQVLAQKSVDYRSRPGMLMTPCFLVC